MTTYWFKPRRYGYGATPTTWQGWAVTFASVLPIVLTAIFVRTIVDRSLWMLAALLAVDAVAIGALFVIGYRKTEGGWRWRWGDR